MATRQDLLELETRRRARTLQTILVANHTMALAFAIIAFTAAGLR